MSKKNDESDPDDEDEDSSDDAMATAATSSQNIQARRNWDESFEALKQYKNRFGTCLVPSAYEKDSALGHWVRKQRRNATTGQLSAARIDKLNSLGFVWKLRGENFGNQNDNKDPSPDPPPKSITTRNSSNKKRTWEESYETLVRYKKKHGNCNVPRRHPPDLPLGQWVSKQRFNKHKLNKKQKEKLEAIGFDFTLRREKTQRAWDSKLEELKEYEAKHGDFDVPDDDPLASWIDDQRKAFMEDRLSEERTNALESIGFSFVENDDDDDKNNDNSNDKNDSDEDYGDDTSPSKPKPKKVKVTLAEKWETQYASLVRFYEEWGHCVVPRNIDKTLSYWVQRQRQLNSQNKLKSERKDQLEKLNFEWYVGINVRPEQYFDEMLQRLKDYKLEFGNAHPPRDYLRGGLGEWVDNLKSQGRDGLMEPEQASRLLLLGFTWTEDPESWVSNLQEVSRELRQCRRRGGDLQLTEEVDSWLKVQHMLLDYDLQTPKRQERLIALGVEWDGESLAWKEGDNMHDYGNSEYGMAFDEKISTGFDLKGAAMSWTPDKKTNPNSTAITASSRSLDFEGYDAVDIVANEEGEVMETEEARTPSRTGRQTSEVMDVSPTTGDELENEDLEEEKDESDVENVDDAADTSPVRDAVIEASHPPATTGMYSEKEPPVAGDAPPATVKDEKVEDHRAKVIAEDTEPSLLQREDGKEKEKDVMAPASESDAVHDSREKSVNQKDDNDTFPMSEHNAETAAQKETSDLVSASTQIKDKMNTGNHATATASSTDVATRSEEDVILKESQSELTTDAAQGRETPAPDGEAAVTGKATATKREASTEEEEPAAKKARIKEPGTAMASSQEQ